MSACKASYRIKRSGPKVWVLCYFEDYGNQGYVKQGLTIYYRNPTPARVLLILQLFFSVGSTHTLTDPSIGLLMQKNSKNHHCHVQK